MLSLGVFNRVGVFIFKQYDCHVKLNFLNNMNRLLDEKCLQNYVWLTDPLLSTIILQIYLHGMETFI